MINRFNIMKKLVYSLLLATIVSCSPYVISDFSQKFPPIDYSEEVTVIGITEDFPDAATELGTVTVGGTDFTSNCGYDEIVEKARIEARKAGGNAIKIIEHLPPSGLGSQCHKITVTVLRLGETPEPANLASADDMIDSTSQYALLYVYRPKVTMEWLAYDLHLGDEVICRVKNNSRQVIKVTKEGGNILWASTEKKSELPVDIEFGKEYYIRCSLEVGVLLAHPRLQLVDKKKGKIEYSKIRTK